MTDTIADLIEGRFGEPTLDGADRPADGTTALLLRHRTHRRFRDEPVADELLRILLAAGLSAPSKSDLQQASIVHVRDTAKRRAVAGLVPDMPWIGTVPVFLVFCGDNRRTRRICELRGKPFANEHLDSFLNAAVDAALVMQNVIVAAEAEGLGCCPISVIRNHADRIAELLRLPAGVFPVAGLCIGWPAAEGYVSMRLPPAVTVHEDAYDDAGFPEQLEAYDRRRDARFSIPAQKQRHRERYGEAAFYGWSEDKARQVSLPERDQLGRFVRGQGFSLR